MGMMDATATNPSDVIFFNPFTWDILWFSSDHKSCYLCAFHTNKMDVIPQPQEQKSYRRQTQCSNTLCEC